MGINKSKIKIPISQNNNIPTPAQNILKKNSSNEDSSFGREIMKNIHLNVSEIKQNSQIPLTQSGFNKRFELNKQTEGLVSWEDLPSVLTSTSKANKVTEAKVQELKEFYALPDK